MENKTAYLIVLCCFLLHMTVVGSDIVLYHTVAHDGTLVNPRPEGYGSRFVVH